MSRPHRWGAKERTGRNDAAAFVLEGDAREWWIFGLYHSNRRKPPRAGKRAWGGGGHETRVGGCESQSQIRPSMDSDVVSGGRCLESPTADI
jgi:hypothetical protein